MDKKKKPRVDKRKNIGKVAEVIAINPHATEREIAKQTGVSNGTAHNARKELEQSGAKDPTIAYIVGSSKERLKTIQNTLDRFVKESEAKAQLTVKDATLIKDIAKDDLQRITILGGDVTDSEGGMKDTQLTEKQLKSLDNLLALMSKGGAT